ncbi:hypothetical protein RJ55_00381 [Drechmeria coniospora]|nr:hypothetical protein RJ55_00381 [Drechmeria coniospora]
MDYAKANGREEEISRHGRGEGSMRRLVAVPAVALFALENRSYARIGPRGHGRVCRAHPVLLHKGEHSKPTRGCAAVAVLFRNNGRYVTLGPSL